MELGSPIILIGELDVPLLVYQVCPFVLVSLESYNRWSKMGVKNNPPQNGQISQVFSTSFVPALRLVEAELGLGQW